MKTVIKNILAVLDKDKFIYTETGIKETEEGKEMPYIELITNEKFVNALAMFISRYAPRSKMTKPKVIYPIGQLNYEEFEDLVTDLVNFMKGAIEDEELEVWLKCILERNIIPNSK